MSDPEMESRTIWGPKGDRIIAATVYAGLAMLAVGGLGMALLQGLDHVASAIGFENTWSWWGGAYLVVGAVLGLIAGVVAFCGLWFWSARVGRFWGFALGWIPSYIAAMVLFGLMALLWGPALLALALFLVWT